MAFMPAGHGFYMGLANEIINLPMRSLMIFSLVDNHWRYDRDDSRGVVSTDRVVLVQHIRRISENAFPHTVD